jgi:hypothetical protein
MTEEVLRRDLFLLLGYLLTSARGLFEEPKGYGPFRLVDTAGRLLEIMEAHGLNDAFLAELQEDVAAERFGNSNDNELLAALDDLCARYATELKARTPTTESAQ